MSAVPFNVLTLLETCVNIGAIQCILQQPGFWAWKLTTSVIVLAPCEHGVPLVRTGCVVSYFTVLFVAIIGCTKSGLSLNVFTPDQLPTVANTRSLSSDKILPSFHLSVP